MSLALTVAGVCLLAIYSVYFLLNRRISRVLDSDKLLEKVDEEINSLILEMNQTTERNILLIEDRINSLNKLVKDADKAIMLLSRELEKRKEEPSDYAHLSRIRKFPTPVNEMVREPEKTDENLSEKHKILELYNQGLSTALIASQTGTSIGEVELIISLNSRKG